MKKEIPVKQLGAARIPSPLPLSSKSNYENLHFVKDDARFLNNAIECSKPREPAAPVINIFLFSKLNLLNFITII